MRIVTAPLITRMLGRSTYIWQRSHGSYENSQHTNLIMFLFWKKARRNAEEGNAQVDSNVASTH